MSEPKGPKIELPDELAAELEEEVAPAAESSTGGEVPTQAPPAASGEPATAEPSEAAPSESPEQDVETLQRELDELKDRYLRLAADFENTRRRVLKEREELFNYGNEALIKELLETVDNLERALDHAREAEEGVDAKTLLEGVGLTQRGLMRVLERSGVEVVEAEGEPFDPRVHEAVRQVENEEHPPGTVVAVYQKGYLLKDRLLRPALVGVSRRPEAESA